MSPKIGFISSALRLTRRERELLACIVVEGASRQEIAARLRISPRTIKFHVQNLLKKWGTSSEIKMAIEYWRMQLDRRPPRSWPVIAADLESAGRSAELSVREDEVFRRIVEQGLGTKEIAADLRISERTVKFHTFNLLFKLGAPDRCKLAVSYWQSVLEMR